MNWKQIYNLSEQQDRTEQVVKLLRIIEARHRRPIFLRTYYISPRYVKHFIPGKKVFLASAFSLLSQYVALDKAPVLAVFGMIVNFALIAMLVTFRVRRVLMETQGRTLSM